MRILITLFAFLVLTTTAHAENIRRCVGPYTLSSNNYAPGSDGAVTRDFDGDITVQIWKIGPDAITVDIEGTTFTAVEDSTGASFKSMSQKTGSDLVTIKGPLERMRLNVSGCGTDCTTKAKICGRISN